MHLSNEIKNDFRTMGLFDFNGSITGNAMADLMLGQVYRFWQGGGEYKELKGLPVWRLCAGQLAHDNESDAEPRRALGSRCCPTRTRSDACSVLCRELQSTRFPNAPLGYLNAGDKGCPEGGFEKYWKSFSPRFGFAYRPGGGKTVVRGGAGLFWNPQFTVLYNGFVNSAPFSPQVTVFGVPFENPYAGAKIHFRRLRSVRSAFELDVRSAARPVWRFLKRIPSRANGIIQLHARTGSMGRSSATRQLCRQPGKAPILQLRSELRALCSGRDHG